jgi:hypothetical protein
MTKPTPAQLKAEIESGPLAAALAGPWATVFPTEPEPTPGTPAHARWSRIASRFGKLTPDGIAGLKDVLNDPTRASRLVPRRMSLTDLPGAGVNPASVAAVFGHSRFTEFREIVNNQDHAGAKEFAALFSATGVITTEDLTAFNTYADAKVSEECSLLTAKDWEVDDDLLQQAKAV